MPITTAGNVVHFGCFEADLSACRLLKRGIRIRLREQSFQVLALLLEHPGRAITREELRRRLWGDGVFVDFDNNLNAVVAHLREMLGDSAEHPRFIETLPKRGYRFIGTVLPQPSPSPAAPRQRPRLLVLPFLNLSGDAGQEYFSDAITDEIITALAVIAPEQLAVIARTTAMHYKGSRKDVAHIGRELNVDYVVEGGIRRSNDDIAINVQLIQVSDQAHLFARQYESELHDIFEIQSSIAQGVAEHIPAIVHQAGGEHARKPTENLVAYNEYVKGRYEMWKWTPESVTRAKQYFEAALEHDPRFALACDGLANLYWYLGFWGFAPPDETEPIRRFYALRAFELDSNLAGPQALAAFHPEKCNYIEPYSYNWGETEEQMALARELEPNSPLILVRHATVLLVLGRIEEAVADLERALDSDPLSLEVHFWLGVALFLGRRYERGLEQARKLVELVPEHQVAYLVLGQVYLGMQSYPESVTALRHAVEISRELPFMLGWLGLALGLGGHVPEARAVLERLQSIAAERFVLPTSFAWLHLGLGEIDEAFVWMQRAVDRNDEWIHPLRTYPFLDSLRSDPRFAALLRQLNLA
jgi:TolB-like protein/tetratricopeptide (TPR) repeat protein